MGPKPLWLTGAAMPLDSGTIWIITICFGAVSVGMSSWTRFDEPSYDSQSEYFARYKPRFSTSYARYAWAKWGYIWAIISVYFVFSLTPEYFNAITAGEGKVVDSSNIPMAVALAIITLQNVPGLKDLERRIRGFLHSFARIPEGVRRTVAQMRSSQFNFDPNAIALQTRKIGLKNGLSKPGALNKLLMEDDILHGWYSIGCVLFSLSEQSRSKIGIDPLFFDYYEDELDSINARHVAIADPVRQHLAACCPTNPASKRSTTTDHDAAASRDIRDLRDRLYTFVACGVNSSVNTDAESFEILRRLGFTLDRSLDQVHMGPLFRLLVIAGVILSVFTAYSTHLFHATLEHLVPEWIAAFPIIPKETIKLFLWSWSTAAFYIAAIMGALWVRNTQVAKREWFDINNLERARPILRYATPTLIGTAFGCATLFIIALAEGPGFQTSLKSVGEVMHQSLPWFPLAMVMAFIAIVLSDTNLADNRLRWRKILIRGICGGLAMAIVGFLTSTMIVHSDIAAFAGAHRLAVPREVEKVEPYVSLFVAAQICLLASVLCVSVQVSELYTVGTRSLVGKRAQAVARQGPIFSVFFGPAGQACLLPANASDCSPAHALCEGQWQQFPEGTVVKWTTTDEHQCKAGDLGLISAYGDSLIYEGYRQRFSGTAEFTAQVRLRA
jgi:hypothetical protein